MGFFGDLWDDITGKSARDDAQDAVTQANASNQAAAQAMANATLQATDKMIAERKRLVDAYTAAMNQALAGVPNAESIAPKLAELAANQRGDTTGLIERMIRAAQDPLNQIQGQAQTTADQQRSALQPFADAAGQVRGQTQSALLPFLQQAQGMAGAMNPVLAALGLGGQGADFSSLLAQSPAFQYQREQNNRAITNAMVARSMGSGRSAVNQLGEGDRALVAAELDKNINRAMSLGTQGIQMGSQLAGQYAGAGMNELQAAGSAMANVAGQQGATNVGALQALSGVQTAAMPYALQGLGTYYNQMGAIAQMPIEDAWRRFTAQQGIQDIGLQNAISNAAMQQQAAIQAAQTNANAQLASGQNTAAMAMQNASQPSLFSQLLPIGISYATGGFGGRGSQRAPIGPVGTGVNTTNAMPAWGVPTPW